MIKSTFALLFLFITYYGPVDPELHKWFEGLTTPGGGFCCAEADGIKLDDPSWGQDDQGYWVIFKGVKTRVPPDRVVRVRHPQVNYAILWQVAGVIRCFLPGPAA